MEITIDLISDTATRPSSGMRLAMYEAVVGDEQRGEDPTVNELLERAAALLGQERAIFLPSGTMCNQIAFAIHCRPGDEIVAAANSHIVSSEGAGAAVFSGAVIRGIESKTGIFSGEELAAAVRTIKPKAPRTTVVSIEQTTNKGGGTVWKGAQLTSIVNTARERGLLLHMDGARLMNAAVCSEEDIKTYTSLFDSVWIDFTKGLGCPVGSVLAGSKDFISRAEHWKHRFGGAMRQAGILAAAAIYALKFNVERLTEDHHNAKQFAAGIANLKGVSLPFAIPETNIVFVDVHDLGVSAYEVLAKLREKGVRVGVEDTHQLRAVFHLDIGQEKTQRAIQIFSETVSELANHRVS